MGCRKTSRPHASFPHETKNPVGAQVHPPRTQLLFPHPLCKGRCHFRKENDGGIVFPLDTSSVSRQAAATFPHWGRLSIREDASIFRFAQCQVCFANIAPPLPAPWGRLSIREEQAPPLPILGVKTFTTPRVFLIFWAGVAPSTTRTKHP